MLISKIMKNRKNYYDCDKKTQNICSIFIKLHTFILLYMFVYYIFMTSPLWLAVGPQSI